MKPRVERQLMVEKEATQISITKQCELLWTNSGLKPFCAKIEKISNDVMAHIQNKSSLEP